MAHEWIGDHHLRPQTHVHVWLGAVAVFGPLWLYTDSLLEDALQDMHTSDDNSGDALDSNRSDSSDEASVASADAALAGKGQLQ